MAALLQRPTWVLIMLALVLLGQTTALAADGRAVLADADDGQIDACYSQADFLDALHRARNDQRLYANEVSVIREGQFSNVAVAGRPCGSGRSVPSVAIAVGGSGASTLWGGAALLVVAAAVGGGVIARRRPPGGER